jgi:hypothetical protein
MPRTSRNPRAAEQANGYLHDRTIPAVSPTKPLMVSIPPLKHCDTRQKTRLPAPHRVITSHVRDLQDDPLLLEWSFLQGIVISLASLIFYTAFTRADPRSLQ